MRGAARAVEEHCCSEGLLGQFLNCQILFSQMHPSESQHTGGRGRDSGCVATAPLRQRAGERAGECVATRPACCDQSPKFGLSIAA
eukprot:2934427-Prymnesium_polylepis.1